MTTIAILSGRRVVVKDSDLDVLAPGASGALIIDERADERQCEALSTVLHGGETGEARTHWWIFHATSSSVHEPPARPIKLDLRDSNGQLSMVRHSEKGVEKRAR